jgi:hypothetical protein
MNQRASVREAFVGRPLPVTKHLTNGPKRLALPVLHRCPLLTVHATEEAMLVLALAGAAAFAVVTR